MKKSLWLLLMIYCSFLDSNSIAQWVKTNGPWGGTVASCFAGNKNNIYAGSEEIGVFVSTDRQSWKDQLVLIYRKKVFYLF